MPLVLILTLGLHVAAALFWLLSSFVLGWNGVPSASARLFRPQMIGATVAVFSGGGLWQMLHAGGFGRPEAVLAAGAACALAAAGVQGALVGGGARRLQPADGPQTDAGRRVLLGQRIAAGLLAAALVCMMAARHA